MNKEVEKWEKSNYNKLKNRIRDFVPHIRIFTIPLDEYYSDVCPYRGAIPRRTVELLVERYHFVEDTSLPPDALPSRGLEKQLPNPTMKPLNVATNHIYNVLFFFFFIINF